MATEIYEVPDPWPRVFFTTEVDVRASDEAAREALREGEPRAIVFGADAQSLADLARSSEPAFEALALEGEALHRLSVELDGAQAEGVVIFNEAWDPGWRATVDGEPAPVLRANLLHRAVPVPAGAHEVVLVYRPPGLRALSLLWLLTLVGASIVTVRGLLANGAVGREAGR